MKEILKEMYQHCLDMQRIAETKNAGLIAFNGAVSLAVLKLIVDENVNCVIYYYLFFVLGCSLISIFISLTAISAQLKHKELDMPNYKSQNLQFFGTIANYSPEDYLKQLKIEYSIDEETTKYHLDQAKQVTFNAQIALRKFKLFNSGFRWTIAGIATPVSLIFYFIFFNSNK